MCQASASIVTLVCFTVSPCDAPGGARLASLAPLPLDPLADCSGASGLGACQVRVGEGEGVCECLLDALLLLGGVADELDELGLDLSVARVRRDACAVLQRFVVGAQQRVLVIGRSVE